MPGQDAAGRNITRFQPASHTAPEADEQDPARGEERDRPGEGHDQSADEKVDAPVIA